MTQEKIDIALVNDRRASTQNELAALRQDVHSIRGSMEKLADAVARLAVFEERLVTFGEAQERAFETLSKQRDRMDMIERANGDRHRGHDLKIAFVMGIAAAVSVGWTVFGVYLTDSIRSTTATIEAMRTHIAQDKVLTHDDVKQATR